MMYIPYYRDKISRHIQNLTKFDGVDNYFLSPEISYSKYNFLWSWTWLFTFMHLLEDVVLYGSKMLQMYVYSHVHMNVEHVAQLTWQELECHSICQNLLYRRFDYR